jgi:hypothetical protein
MPNAELLRATFSFSPAARQAVEILKKDHDARFPGDPAAILSVGWGYVDEAKPFDGALALGFYTESRVKEVTDGIQDVSGVPLIYFTTERFHPLFDGKVIDHSAEQGFFLRQP